MRAINFSILHIGWLMQLSNYDKNKDTGHQHLHINLMIKSVGWPAIVLPHMKMQPSPIYIFFYQVLYHALEDS